MEEQSWISPWLLAAAGLAAAAWSYVRGVAAWIGRTLIISHSFEGEAAAVLLSALQERAKPSRLFRWSYRAAPMPNGRGRWVLRPYRALGASQGVLWIGAVPVWIESSGGGGSDDDESRPASALRSARRGQNVLVHYFRGTFDVDGELVRAFAARNEAQLRSERGSRFAVYRVTGSAGCYYAPEKATGSLADVDLRFSAIDPVGWTLADVKPPADAELRADFDGDPGVAAREIERWIESEAWYRERGIPWRRGFALAGPPGTGKTSFVRTVARLCDLPVTIFDLATLTNAELAEEWHDAMSRAPCVALFEDFDAVFRGRENVTGADTGLTFDCLLNVLDGVDRAEGVIVFLTTNHLETVDPALLRPGRMDRVVTFGPLSAAARRRIAERVLPGRLAAVERVLAEAAGLELTVAEFQERCFRLALETHFAEPSVPAAVSLAPPSPPGPRRLPDAA